MKHINHSELLKAGQKAFGFVANSTLLLVFSILASSAYSQTQGTITPGGVQPQTERRTLPRESGQPLFEIPAVPDRPLDADEGARIIVSRFQLEGVEDISGTQINREQLNQLLEEIRSAKPEGFTIGQLQETANQITQYYRQQGLILALAIIPQQDINEGVVIIRVFSGQLGQLGTANNQRYSDRLLKWPFQQLVDQPVQAAAVESALLLLDDIPGLEAFGVFRPGKDIGETELVLNAKTETPFNTRLFFDDHGVDTTGKQRVIGNFIWNNPLGWGDRLSITALHTFDPQDSTYGAIYYESLIFSPALSAGFAYSTNDYSIGQSFASTITDGETEIASVFTRYAFTRNRDFSVWGTVDFSRKKAEVSLPIFDHLTLGEDDLSVVSATLAFDAIDSLLGGGINEGSVSYHQGMDDFAGSMDSKGNGKSLRRDSSGAPTGGDFQKFALDLTRLQRVSTNNNILLRLDGQYSSDLLSSIEQYSMGGPNSVRAYPVSEYIYDKALFASAEWIVDLGAFNNQQDDFGPSWESVQLSFFLDYAKGHKNDPLPAEKKEQHISGVGTGLEFNFTDSFFMKIEAATPISKQDASNGNNPQLWFSTGIEF